MLTIRLPLGGGACDDGYQARCADTQRPRYGAEYLQMLSSWLRWHTIHIKRCSATVYEISRLVATSFFPSPEGTCEIERFIVSCGSLLTSNQESPPCALFDTFSIG